jgi:LysR family glycine cleavage system transcriptional activator
LTFSLIQKSFDLNLIIRKTKHMRDWLPSLNALRAFEATARLRSFRKAADELCVTPAAVNQLVSKLEQAMGEPVLERKGSGMELTRTGALGSADLTSAFQQISRAVDRMRANKTDRLVVSVDPSFASAWLVPRLENFRAQYPTIEVLVDSSMHVVDLKKSVADIGIRFGVENHGDQIVHRLFDEHLCAFCSPRLAKGPPKISELADLEQAVLLRWDLSEFEWATNTRQWNFWRTWLDAVGASQIKPGKGVKFNDYNLAVQAAIAGQGFIIGSEPILKILIESNLLVNPFGISAHPGIGYDVVTTHAALGRPNVKHFFEWIVKQSEEANSVSL